MHIYDIKGLEDCIWYIEPNGHVSWVFYYIQDRINGVPLFYESGKIQLLSFTIDVSNNTLVDKYLRHFTNAGKKSFASPEKDSEVVVMNPPNDLIINRYMNSVYILYALQLKYGFLSDLDVQCNLYWKLKNMDSFRFNDCPDERVAFINLIQYLSANWQYESQISQEIYKYSKKEEHISMGYDPILQFHDIMQNDFEESYNLSTYNENVVSDLFWKYCGRYLGYQI